MVKVTMEEFEAIKNKRGVKVIADYEQYGYDIIFFTRVYKKGLFGGLKEIAHSYEGKAWKV